MEETLEVASHDPQEEGELPATEESLTFQTSLIITALEQGLAQLFVHNLCSWCVHDVEAYRWSIRAGFGYIGEHNTVSGHQQHVYPGHPAAQNDTRIVCAPILPKHFDGPCGLLRYDEKTLPRLWRLTSHRRYST
eukprot:3163975-Amphidinium_carterae.1